MLLDDALVGARGPRGRRTDTRAGFLLVADLSLTQATFWPFIHTGTHASHVQYRELPIRAARAYCGESFSGAAVASAVGDLLSVRYEGEPQLPAGAC